MANTFKFGNGKWAVGKDTVLAYNDQNSNFKPLPFTFDRASTATVVNKDGLIETVGVDEPRIDFLNNTSGHLLLEPSRTNNITYSEDFTEWNVTASGTTLTSNSAISPDGSQTADLLESDGTNAFSRVYETVSLTSGNNCLYSTFVKKSGSHDFASIRVQGTDVGGAGQTGSTYTFTFSTETLSYEGGGSATSTFVENYGSGWYRIGMELTNSTVTQVIIYPKFNSSVAGEILMWGAQLEEGSYPTSYIPTSGSTVTRLTEVSNAAGTVSDFNSVQGVLFADLETVKTSGSRVSLSQAADPFAERVSIDFNTATNIRFFVEASNDNNTFNVAVDTVLKRFKIAVKWNGVNISVFIDGFEAATDTFTGFTADTLDRLQMTAANGIGSIFEGDIYQLMTFNEALTDSELEQITSCRSFGEMAKAQQYTIE